MPIHSKFTGGMSRFAVVLPPEERETMFDHSEEHPDLNRDTFMADSFNVPVDDVTAFRASAPRAYELVYEACEEAEMDIPRRPRRPDMADYILIPFSWAWHRLIVESCSWGFQGRWWRFVPKALLIGAAIFGFAWLVLGGRW